MGVEEFNIETDVGGYDCLLSDGSDFSEIEDYFSMMRELGVFREHVKENYDGGGLVVLKDLWVDDEYRGEGHGSALLVDFLGFVRDRGFSHVYLIADEAVSNEIDLADWYAGYGFEHVEGHGRFMVLMYRRV